MGYWQEVNDVIKKGVDLAVSQIRESTDEVVAKTKEGALAAKIKSKLFLKHRELHDIMADLGDIVFDLYKDQKDIYSDHQVKQLIEKADAKINECKKISDEAGIEGDKCSI